MRASFLTAVLLAAGAAASGGARAQVVSERRVVADAPGWIGISFAFVGTEGRSGTDVRAVITGVNEGSPAAVAGVTAGDVLVSINGLGRDNGLQDAADRLRLRPGDRTELVVLRNGRQQTFELRAVPRPQSRMVAVGGLVPLPVDSMVDVMFQAMDSLRIRLVRQGPTGVGAVAVPEATRRRTLVVTPEGPGGFPAPIVTEVRAPFEFFLFGGEANDSLRRSMEILNRSIRETRARHEKLARDSELRPGDRRLASELGEVRRLIDEQNLRATRLRDAMSEAARVEADARVSTVWSGQVSARAESRGDDPAGFRPLTPYLLGQNRAAGARVVDLEPELASYFGVESGVLVVDVPAGTPAYSAGIRPGDVITHVGEAPVDSLDELRAALSVGLGPLALSLVRKGESVEVTLRR